MVPELRQEAILASVRSRDISYIKDLAEELCGDKYQVLIYTHIILEI